MRERHCRCNALDSRVFLLSPRGCGTPTDVLSYLACGLKSDRENSLPFRRGSPCCDLFEGPDNRQLLEGYSARRRQEALTNFPVILDLRSFLGNDARSVKRERKDKLTLPTGKPLLRPVRRSGQQATSRGLLRLSSSGSFQRVLSPSN